MITREAAILITSDSFPNGPEALTRHLSIEVSSSPLVGVEGWCIRGVTTVIRLNSSSSRFRQRFTLAHELAHLVLGTEPDILTEPFQSDRQEEREADQLAAEFLIPHEKLEELLQGTLPVDAKTLSRLANVARVSPVMAACRVVSAADKLGLQNAAVVFFMEGKEQWRYSNGLRFDEDSASELLQEAISQKPVIARIANCDGNVIVGSIIDARKYQVLLIQLLSPSQAAQSSYDERVNHLACELFQEDHSFRQSVAASLGVVKKKCAGQSLSQAFGYFMQHYPGVKYCGLKDDKLRSQPGREYIRLFLQRWFQ